ncbi:phage tail protein [Acinetobacter baumannii]|uniref:phage tail protein n=1 Tax=Acinetobacter baumannii TaxID=470 RepID=UPI001D18FB02|nr:phage tail protein [Acinetobacter baumannii]
MATQYFSVFTEQGLALLRESIQNGTKLGITRMSFGDGGGSLPTPDSSVTHLVNEVYQTPLNSLAPDPNNSNWLRAEAVISSAVGGFNIRELGLWSENILVAYSNYPPTYKPNPSDGTARIMTFRMVLQIDNTANFELKIDADIVMATLRAVEDAKNEAIQYADSLTKGLVTNVNNVDELYDIEKPQSGQVVYVKDLGNFQYNSSTLKWDALDAAFNERRSKTFFQGKLDNALQNYSHVKHDSSEVVINPVTISDGQTITSNNSELKQDSDSKPVIESVYNCKKTLISGLNLIQSTKDPIAGGTSNNHAMLKFHGGAEHSAIFNTFKGQYGISFGYGSITEPDRTSKHNLVAFNVGKKIQGMFIENIGASYTRVIGNCLDSDEKGNFHAIRLSGYDKNGNPNETAHAPCHGVVGSSNVLCNITNGISAQNSSKYANFSAMHLNNLTRAIHSTAGTTAENNPSMHRFDLTAKDVGQLALIDKMNHSSFKFTCDGSGFNESGLVELSGLGSYGFNSYDGLIKNSASTPAAQFRYSHNLYNMQVNESVGNCINISGNYGCGNLIAAGSKSQYGAGVVIYGHNNNLDIVSTNNLFSSISISNGNNNVLKIVTDGNVRVEGNNNIIIGKVGGTVVCSGNGNQFYGEITGTVTDSGTGNNFKNVKGFSGEQTFSETPDAVGKCLVTISNKHSSNRISKPEVYITNNTQCLRAIVTNINSSGNQIEVTFLDKVGNPHTSSEVVFTIIY